MSTATELLNRAQAATSLNDFAENSFREGLEILVQSIATQARLTERGRAGFESQIVDLLSNRP